MKNYKLFSLLGITLLSLTLGACGNSGGDIKHHDVEIPEVDTIANDIKLDNYSYPLFVGDTEQINVRKFPGSAYKANVRYESDNPEVASVSETGLITANKSGIANIRVTVNDGNGELHKDAVVYVGDSIVWKELKSKREAQLALQEPYGDWPDAVRIHEVRDSFHLLDGVNENGYTEDSDYIISKRDGYVGFGGWEADLQTKLGNFEEVNYAWMFYTADNYMSHLYHEYNGVNTRMSVATQSYIGKERIQCVIDIINNLFTRAQEVLIDQNVEASLETKQLSGSNLGSKSAWFKDDDNELLIIRSSGIFEGETIDPDYESNAGIPAGTVCTITQDVSYCWLNGVCVAERILVNYEYTIDEENRNFVMNIRQTNSINDDVVVNLPDNSKYTLVDQLYDL